MRGVVVQRYSFASLVRQALRRNVGWRPAWREPQVKPGYDVVVIGGGGHGLATAYYLAKNHGITNVAVIEKGWLGGGNTGRNTTVVRSDYVFPESSALYDLSLRLYEGLSRDFNFNIMLSQRGYMMLIHSQHQLESARHKVNWLACNGVDGELISREEVRRMVPLLNMDETSRNPVIGAWTSSRTVRFWASRRVGIGLSRSRRAEVGSPVGRLGWLLRDIRVCWRAWRAFGCR